MTLGEITLNTEKVLSLSSNSLFIAFVLLLLAILPLGLAVKSKGKVFAKAGLVLTVMAFVLQLNFF